jgi:hypothetical protein
VQVHVEVAGVEELDDAEDGVVLRQWLDAQLLDVRPGPRLGALAVLRMVGVRVTAPQVSVRRALAAGRALAQDQAAPVFRLREAVDVGWA